MDPLHARYPFLEAARTAVTEEAPPIEELVVGTSRSAALERAIDRIERALDGTTVGSVHSDPEVEVLSYPLARVVVSLVDDDRVTERYATAEARTARERLASDFTAETPSPSILSKQAALSEFEVEYDPDTGMAVADYLRLAADLSEESFRLVNRALRNGRVPISERELLRLLEAAVYHRVRSKLPLTVPEELAGRLDGAVDRIEDRLGRQTLPESFDRIDPSVFPPCMEALVDRVEAGEDLPPHSRFALASFLTSIGLTSEDLHAVVEEPVPDALTAMAEAVAGTEGPTQFPPGSCETMVAFGDCVNQDELCQQIEHPLEYYDRRLEAD